MSVSEAIRIALLSLWANKLRSVLTLLGVVIGVSAVIAVVTFVNGINGYVAEKVFNLGADVFIVSKMPNVVTDVDQFIEGNKRKDITMDNYQAVVEGLLRPARSWARRCATSPAKWCTARRAARTQWSAAGLPAWSRFTTLTW